MPPTSIPEPRCAPSTGPTSVQNSGSLPKIALPSATRRSASPGACACWTTQSLAPRCVQLAQVGDHPLERPAVGADPADRCDLGAERQDRLDLQRGPIIACAAPMRPPRRRYSSVSRQNQMSSVSRARATAARISSRPPPCSGDVGRGHHQAAEAAGAGAPVEDLDPAGPLPRRAAVPLRGRSRRFPTGRRRCGSERMSWPASSSGRSRRRSRRPRAARWSAAAASRAAVHRTRRGRCSRAPAAARRPSRRTGSPGGSAGCGSALPAGRGCCR